MAAPDNSSPNPQDPGIPKSAVRLSLLDLNNIRLDVKHTILTPSYLENLPEE